MLILASASPRRKELLSRITEDFLVCPTDADESLPAGIDPESSVRTIALRKAFAAAVSSSVGPEDWVLTADTVVAVGDRILGKPADRQEAQTMLDMLSGRTHTVITAWVLACPGIGEFRLGAERTQVTFRTLDRQDTAFYLATDEPYDKAGAYGIQGRAAAFITGISGDYTNVVGLPVPALYSAMKEAGLADSTKVEV